MSKKTGVQTWTVYISGRFEMCFIEVYCKYPVGVVWILQGWVSVMLCFINKSFETSVGLRKYVPMLPSRKEEIFSYMTGFVFYSVVCKDVDYRIKLIPFLSYEQAGLFFFYREKWARCSSPLKRISVSIKTWYPLSGRLYLRLNLVERNKISVAGFVLGYSFWHMRKWKNSSMLNLQGKPECLPIAFFCFQRCFLLWSLSHFYCLPILVRVCRFRGVTFLALS